MANEWVRGTVSLIPNVSPNHTITNAINAFQSVLTQSGWELASWSPGGNDRYFLRTDRSTRERWRYEGDGPIQSCGIHVYAANSNTEIRVSAFLENSGATAVQVDANGATATTNRRGYLTIAWDTTAPNNYLFIAGEDGFYVEAGRDSSSVNLGHGAILTDAEIPELNATKSTQVRWVTQGFALDLFGECRFTGNRNARFVTNNGTNRNFTSNLQVYATRGANSTTQSPSPVDYASYYFGNRDLMNGLTSFSTITSADWRYACTFGQLNTPEDGRYRVNPILIITESNAADVTARSVSSTSTSNVVAPSGNNFVVRDVRHDRQILRFVVVDYTLLPFANIVEAQTGKVYRVIEHNDNGRTSNIAVEWPTTVVTPALT